MSPAVHLVTARHLPDLAPDDRELLHALRRLGTETEVVVWDDPMVDFAAAPVTVVRSVFDYHLRRPEFLAWVDSVEPLTSLFNPAEVIRWNSHKSYLQRLEADGFPVIQTEWVPQGGAVDLGDVLTARSWSRAVVKPAVSASAYGTVEVSAETLAAAQAHLQDLSEQGDGLVQPYLPEFRTVGESSVIWLDGERTHAVRRPSGMHTSLDIAHVGEPLQPSDREVALAGAVYDWISPRPLYARIDLLDTQEYGLLVLEVELVEPALYLRHSPAIADRFARAVQRMVALAAPG